MKIAYDAKRAFFNYVGLGNYSRTLLQGLANYYPENEYHLFSPPLKDIEFANKFLSNSDRFMLHTPKGIKAKLHSLWRSFGLAHAAQKKDCEIFHGLSHELPVGIEKSGIKSVVTMHDLIFIRFPQFFPLIDRIGYKAKFSHAVKNADSVIAICEQTKTDLINYLNVKEEKIKVLYQSANPLYFTPPTIEMCDDWAKGRGIEWPYMLYVGSFAPRKNLLAVIKAFAQSRSRTDGMKLVLIGDGKDYKVKMFELINKLNLADYVRVISGVQNEELPYFYAKAEFFLFPSFFEGFGIPIVESLFSKTPVITSYGSCFPESAGPGALYVDPYRVDDLVDKIDTLAFDNDLKKKLTLDGNIYVNEKFHQKITSDHLNSHYHSMI